MCKILFCIQLHTVHALAALVAIMKAENDPEYVNTTRCGTTRGLKSLRRKTLTLGAGGDRLTWLADRVYSLLSASWWA